MDDVDLDTPEGRLECFCRALEDTDEDLIPRRYQSGDPTAFCADMRSVIAKARAAP